MKYALNDTVRYKHTVCGDWSEDSAKIVQRRDCVDEEPEYYLTDHGWFRESYIESFDPMKECALKGLIISSEIEGLDIKSAVTRPLFVPEGAVDQNTFTSLLRAWDLLKDCGWELVE